MYCSWRHEFMSSSIMKIMLVWHRECNHNIYNCINQGYHLVYFIEVYKIIFDGRLKIAIVILHTHEVTLA